MSCVVLESHPHIHTHTHTHTHTHLPFLQGSPDKTRKESTMYFYEKPHNFKVRISSSLATILLSTNICFSVCLTHNYIECRRREREREREKERERERERCVHCDMTTSLSRTVIVSLKLTSVATSLCVVTVVTAHCLQGQRCDWVVMTCPIFCLILCIFSLIIMKLLPIWTNDSRQAYFSG